MSQLTLFERIKHNVLLTNPEWTKEEREEKIMKRRLDVFFCSWASLSAIVKYLDQTNISNGKCVADRARQGASADVQHTSRG